MKRWPALDAVHGGQPDCLLAALDDFQPSAIEERGRVLRAFFSDGSQRDAAADALAVSFPVRCVDVPDDDWARRSQENLKAVTVGRITITPPWLFSNSGSGTEFEPGSGTEFGAGLGTEFKPGLGTESGTGFTSDPIVILPSMGFGTGHHATTRLCLAALQRVDLQGRTLLDVGTGSGVLALAARALGAREALGIDNDPDAIQSATENLELNPRLDRVRYETIDFRIVPPARADVVTANLTGALLERAATMLSDLVLPGGTLIVSGLQTHERAQVFSAFRPLEPVWEQQEDEWIGAAFNRPVAGEV